VAIVHKCERTIAFGKLVDLVQWCNISIHGENTICNDDSESAVLSLLQRLLQKLHVHVLVAQTTGFAKSDSINDTSMVEFIRDNGIFRGQSCFKEASIRVEATRVKDCIVEFVEVSDSLLEVLVNVLRSTDEADG